MEMDPQQTKKSTPREEGRSENYRKIVRKALVNYGQSQGPYSYSRSRRDVQRTDEGL